MNWTHYKVIQRLVIHLAFWICKLNFKYIMNMIIFFQVMLGALLALIHAHKQCLTIDKEAVAGFDQKLKEERKRADDQALYFASTFLLYVEKIDKAREYVDRLLKINPLNKDGLILKGWVEVVAVLHVYL